MKPKPKPTAEARKPFTCRLPLGPSITDGLEDCRCIPLDSASVAALRRKIQFKLAEADAWEPGTYLDQDFSQEADAVLAAIGIKHKKGK